MSCWSLYLQFDLTDNDPFLILSSDIQRYSQKSFMDGHLPITFVGPNEKHLKLVPMHICSRNEISMRARVYVIGINPTAQSLLTTSHSLNARITALAKIILRSIRAPEMKMLKILERER